MDSAAQYTVGNAVPLLGDDEEHQLLSSPELHARQCGHHERGGRHAVGGRAGAALRPCVDEAAARALPYTIANLREDVRHLSPADSTRAPMLIN